MTRTSTLIFLDTSSLLVACWKGDDRKGEQIVLDAGKEATFWSHEIPRLSGTGRLILAARNHEELVKHSRSAQKKDLAERAKYTLAKLVPLVKAGTVEVAGDANDPFADAVLLSVALKFRTQANLHFITQDRALAKDLHRIVEFESVRPRGGQTMVVSRVARSGSVEAFSNLLRTDGPKIAAVPRAAGLKVVAAAPEAPTKRWWERVGLGKT